jgi:hypothetical protein
VFNVNVRVLAPPGASTLDQFSVIVVDVLLGVVGVLSPAAAGKHHQGDDPHHPPRRHDRTATNIDHG